MLPATAAAGATGVAGVIGATGSVGPTGATGSAGSQHVHGARSSGGSKSQTLSLSAPAGQDYAAFFTAQATVLSPAHTLTCTLKFGTVVQQTMVFAFETSTVEVALQGYGMLSSGQITVTSTSKSTSDSVANMSLIATVASATN